MPNEKIGEGSVRQADASLNGRLARRWLFAFEFTRVGRLPSWKIQASTLFVYGVITPYGAVLEKPLLLLTSYYLRAFPDLLSIPMDCPPGRIVRASALRE